MIREISTCDQMRESVEVIRTSFITETAKFGITEQNCPTHPAFLTFAWLVEMKSKGIRMFGWFEEGKQIGFVAVGQTPEKLHVIERLSVLPDYRHKGLGRRLVEHAIEYVRKQKGGKVALYLVNEHVVLKAWYRDQGFHEVWAKEYDHLPFSVCYMEKELSDETGKPD